MRVLLLESNPRTRMLLRTLLVHHFPLANIRVCFPGLLVPNVSPYDAVLSKVTTSRMSGLTLCRLIRARYDVPVVLYSFHQCFDKDAMTAGAYSFIKVPCRDRLRRSCERSNQAARPFYTGTGTTTKYECRCA